MKKSELRQIIREEIRRVTEAGPSQQEIFAKAEKDYKDLLKFLKKWDRQLGDDDPTDRQQKAAEKVYNQALKDFKPFLDSDSDAIVTHNTAASRLHKNITDALKDLKYVLYGD